MIEEISKQIKKSTKSIVLQNELLSKHSNIKIGGPVKLLIIPSSIKDVTFIIDLMNKKNQSYFVIGNGTNILFPDCGIDGIIIKMETKEGQIERVGRELICDSRILLPNLLKSLIKEGLSGLEFTAGVPATIGGAVVSNFGAHGFEIGDFITTVEGIDRKGQLKTIFKKDLNFSYRYSSLQDGKIILTRIFLKLKKDNPANIKKRISEYLINRKLYQPLNLPNIGSIFKNPPGESAGKLVEAAGLKGIKIGGAQISNKHANIIVNIGGAKAIDVISLINKAKNEVFQKFNIELIPEVKIFAPTLKSVVNHDILNPKWIKILKKT